MKTGAMFAKEEVPTAVKEEVHVDASPEEVVKYRNWTVFDGEYFYEVPGLTNLCGERVHCFVDEEGEIIALFPLHFMVYQTRYDDDFFDNNEEETEEE